MALHTIHKATIKLLHHDAPTTPAASPRSGSSPVSPDASYVPQPARSSSRHTPASTLPPSSPDATAILPETLKILRPSRTRTKFPHLHPRANPTAARRPASAIPLLPHTPARHVDTSSVPRISSAAALPLPAKSHAPSALLPHAPWPTAIQSLRSAAFPPTGDADSDAPPLFCL